MNLLCDINDDKWDEPIHMFKEYNEWNKQVRQNILLIEYLERVKSKIETYDDCKLLKYGYRYLNKPNIYNGEVELPHDTKVKLQFIDRYFYGLIYVSESVTFELQKWGPEYCLVLFNKPCDSNDHEIFNKLFGKICWILIHKQNIFEILC